jgi:cytochrome c
MNFAQIVVAVSVLACAPSFASSKLASQKACLACHASDKKIVGPSYQEIAKKYAGQNDALVVLTKAIKTGGSGKYGAVPMPPQAALSEADAKTLAAWVLAGAK